jgi:hypothetical protein
MRSVSPLRLLSTGLALAAGSLATASGCADNESSLFIVGVLLSEGGNCIFEAEPDSAILGSGTLDVAIARTYAMPLLVGNQLVARGDSDKLRTETARISLRGAVVTVLRADGNTTLQSFSTNATGFVNPATGSTPGWGITLVNAIPSSLGRSLFDQLPRGDSMELNVTVSVFGDTLGGDEIESSTITFPLFVCNGCLVDCSTVNSLNGSCATFPEDELEVGCFPGQDAATPCQFADDPENICSAL